VRLIAPIVVAFLSAAASAQDVRPKRSDLDATIDRGLGFLVKNALAWKKNHNCASCYHAALEVWTMRERVGDPGVVAEYDSGRTRRCTRPPPAQALA
jgi:hypothetical protein